MTYTQQTPPNIFWFKYDHSIYKAVRCGFNYEIRMYDPILGLRNEVSLCCGIADAMDRLNHTRGDWTIIPELKPFYRIKTTSGEIWIYGGLNSASTNHLPTDLMLYRTGTCLSYSSVDHLIEQAVSIYQAPNNKDMLNPDAVGVELWRNTTVKQDSLLIKLQQAEQQVRDVRSELEATGYSKSLIDAKLTATRAAHDIQ